MKKLIIAGQEFDSRLFLGTGKFHSNTTMEEAILASGCEMVTVAMKRIELDDKERRRKSCNICMKILCSANYMK